MREEDVDRHFCFFPLRSTLTTNAPSREFCTNIETNRRDHCSIPFIRSYIVIRRDHCSIPFIRSYIVIRRAMLSVKAVLSKIRSNSSEIECRRSEYIAAHDIRS
jgi:hypothetical protein